METNNFNEHQYNPPVVQEQLPNATTILVMGILSLVLCGIIGLVCGIIGLNMAGKAKTMYEANPARYTSASFSNVNSGRICSLIGVILSSVGILILIVYLIFVFAVVGAAGGFSNI